MSRYIDADLIQYHTFSFTGKDGSNFSGSNVAFKEEIDLIPTVNIGEEKTTTLEPIHTTNAEGENMELFECLHCHGPVKEITNYCPHCGFAIV